MIKIQEIEQIFPVFENIMLCYPIDKPEYYINDIKIGLSGQWAYQIKIVAINNPYHYYIVNANQRQAEIKGHLF